MNNQTDDDHRHLGVRFSELVTQEHQWTQLEIMFHNDSSGFSWRALGNALGKTTRELDFIESRVEPQNRVRACLAGWQHHALAYADVLLDVLRDMNHYRAYELVHSWINCGKYQVLRTLSSNKTLDDLKPWKHVKLILLGDSGAGKTSTIRWLKGRPFVSSHVSTVGADLHTTDMCDWREIELDTKDFIADLINSKLAEHSTNNLPDRLPETKKRKVPDNNNNVYSNNNTPTISPELVKQIEEKCLKHQNELPSVFHVWDFGGQEVYYNTHHFFLSTSTIYMLVIDISKPLDLPQIRFWLDSLQFYARDAPVIIVGTHRDCVPPFWQRYLYSFLFNQYFDPQLIDKLKAEYSPKGINIIEGFTVSCKYDLPTQLRQALLDIATTDSSLQRKCKLRWMLFFDALKEQSKQIPSHSLASLSIQTVMELANQCAFRDQNEAIQALIFFHELGFILYFHTEEKLKDIVFTRPEQLIELFNHTIITTDVERKKYFTDQEQSLLSQEGIISHNTLTRLWKKFPQDLHPKFKVLLTKFGLGLPDPNVQSSPECDYIFPCLIEKPETTLDNEFKNALVLECSIHVVPPLGFASRLIVRILEITSINGAHACHLYKGGGIFHLNEVKTKLDIEAGKVTIRLLKTDNDNCLKTLQMILDCVYSTAAKESAPTIETAMATCINGHQQKIFVFPKQGIAKLHYLHLCCKKCRGEFNISHKHPIHLFAPQHEPEQIVNELQYHITSILLKLQMPKAYITDGIIQKWGNTDYEKAAGLYQYLLKSTNPQLLEVVRSVMTEKGLDHLLFNHSSDMDTE